MGNKFTKALKIAGIVLLVSAVLPFVLAAAVIWLAVTFAKMGAAAVRGRNKFPIQSNKRRYKCRG